MQDCATPAGVRMVLLTVSGFRPSKHPYAAAEQIQRTLTHLLICLIR